MGDGDGRADTRAPVVGRGDAREDPLVLEIAVESAKGKTGRLGERGGGEEKGRKKRREGEERVNEGGGREARITRSCRPPRTLGRAAMRWRRLATTVRHEHTSASLTQPLVRINYPPRPDQHYARIRERLDASALQQRDSESERSFSKQLSERSKY